MTWSSTLVLLWVHKQDKVAQWPPGAWQTSSKASPGARAPRCPGNHSLAWLSNIPVNDDPFTSQEAISGLGGVDGLGCGSPWDPITRQGGML